MVLVPCFVGNVVVFVCVCHSSAAVSFVVVLLPLMSSSSLLFIHFPRPCHRCCCRCCDCCWEVSPSCPCPWCCRCFIEIYRPRDQYVVLVTLDVFWAYHPHVWCIVLVLVTVAFAIYFSGIFAVTVSGSCRVVVAAADIDIHFGNPVSRHYF